MMACRLVRGLAAAVLLVGPVACTTSRGDDSGSRANLDDAQSAVEVALDQVIDDLHVYADEHDGLSGGLQLQLDALSDNEVSEAEYRQGVADARECLLRAGLEVSEIHKMIDTSGWQFMFMFEPGAAPPDESEDIADRCQSEHSIFLAAGWAHQKSDSLRPEYKDALDECFTALGTDTTDARRLEDYIDVVGRGNWSDHECQQEAREVIIAQNADIEWW